MSCRDTIRADSDASGLQGHASGGTAQLVLRYSITSATTTYSTDISDAYGPGGAVGGWVHCRCRRRSRTPLELSGTTASRLEQQADDLEAGLIPLQADCTTTRPHGSMLTRQFDARDSKPILTGCSRRGTGRALVSIHGFSGGTFISSQLFQVWDIYVIRNSAQRQHRIFQFTPTTT